MKKLTLLFAAMLGLAGQASAQQELELTPTWNCSKQTIVVNDPSAPQLPATVTLQGNYAFITVTENFSSAEYTHYKFVFGEAIASSALAATCKGDDFRTSIEEGATEFSGEFSKEATITRFGIQNTGSDAVTFILNDFILYNADGTEWHPTLKTAFSWTESGAGTIASEGGEESEVWSFNQWGALGYTFPEQIVPEEGDVHRFVVTSSQPFPAGFQFKVVRGSNDGDAIYPVQFTEGETTATLELSTENIHKTEGDGIDYFNAVQIQAMQNSLTLPADIKMTYEVKYANGMLTRETLPIKVGTYSSANIIDPYPSMEQGENGLPIRVSFSSQWQDIKLWKDTFNVTEYPACRIVLDSRPAEGELQFFYRTDTHGSSGGIYISTEDERLTVTETEEGVVYEFDFDVDALEGDNDVLRLALQHRTSNAVSTIIKNVYLMNEDEEWLETEGLTNDSWNAATLLPVGGSYDEEGNIYDAFVKFNASGDYIGSYSGTVEDGTYHKVKFYTEEPLPEGFSAICQNVIFDWSTWQTTIEEVPFDTEGTEGNVLVVNIPASHNNLYVRYSGEELPLTVRFTKIVREVYEGEYEVVTGIQEMTANSEATPKTNQIFDLNGRRVAQPQKGLYIINGKKVIVK